VGGWYPGNAQNNKFDTYRETPRVIYTVDTCAAEAKKRGRQVFTLRQANHRGGGTFPSSCIGFDLTMDFPTDSPPPRMLEGDTHVTACTDPSKRWPKCK
jgi:hypothetical protein